MSIRDAMAFIMSNPQSRAVAQDTLERLLIDAHRICTANRTYYAHVRSTGDPFTGTPSPPLSVTRAAHGSPVADDVMTRRAVSHHGGLTDHPSRVAPLVSRVLGTDTVSDTVWATIETLRRDGWHGIPFVPRAAARARDAAHRAGRIWAVDRLDDVISDAIERAYHAINAMIARGMNADDDSVSIVTVFVAAPTDDIPIGNIAAFMVRRQVKCGKCDNCTGNSGSRYVIGGCEAPCAIDEWTTAARIMSRALYASAAASVSGERYARVTRDGVLPATHILPDDPRECGHGSTCRLPACIAENLVRAVIMVCEATGTALIGGNGRVSMEAENLLTAATGHQPTERGRRDAMTKIRLLLRPAT
jgi:hypothetical protein